MKHVFFASLLTVSLASVTQAADLPQRTAPLLPEDTTAESWTGFYAGAVLGADRQNTSGPFGNSGYTGQEPYSVSATKAVAGLRIGYDHKFDGFVVGVLGEILMKDGRKANKRNFEWNSSGVYYDITAKHSSQVSGLGKVGYIFNSTLFYSIGGVTIADVETTYALTGNAPGKITSTRRAGWTAGVGVEHHLTNAITAFVEVRHSDLGKKSFDDASVNVADRVSARSSLGLIGINYKF